MQKSPNAPIVHCMDQSAFLELQVAKRELGVRTRLGTLIFCDCK
jgi:hypothetical protein